MLRPVTPTQTGQPAESSVAIFQGFMACVAAGVVAQGDSPPPLKFWAAEKLSENPLVRKLSSKNQQFGGFIWGKFYTLSNVCIALDRQLLLVTFWCDGRTPAGSLCQSLKEGRSDECRCADHKVTTRMTSDANTTEWKNMPARTSPGQTRSAIPAEQSGLGR